MQLKLYGTDFTLNPIISDDYNPKADNAKTILNDRLAKPFYVILFYEMFGPFLGAFAAGIVISYYHITHDTLQEQAIERHNKRGWEIRRNIYIIVAMSLVFSAYVVCLDIVALVYQNQKLEMDFKAWYGYGHKMDVSNILTTLPILSMIRDALALLLFCLSLVVTRYKSTLSPKYALYFMLFPIFILTGHADTIIIGFIHNVYHASAVFILYGIAFAISVSSLRMISVVACKQASKSKETQFSTERCVFITIFTVILIVIFFFFGCFISMYILLPINVAIDDGSNHLITLYQSTAVVFIAYITYWFLLKDTKSPLDFLIKVRDAKLREKVKQEGMCTLTIEEQSWVNKTNEEKEYEVAEGIQEVIERLGTRPQQPTELSLM